MFRVPRFFFGFRQAFQAGYTRQELKADIMAGMIVGLVAVPLSMALAIATGVPPQHGLYTAIIGGMIIGLSGGSRFNVSGPTAAFVVILAPIVHKFGFAGLATAGLMAGAILLTLSFFGAGKLIRYIPRPVILGFTAGIAVVIATIQLKDFFGLHPKHMPESYVSKVRMLFDSRGTFTPIEIGFGLFTLVLLLVIPKITRRVPAPLVAMAAMSVAAAFVNKYFPQVDLALIGNRFSSEINGVVIRGVPPGLPHFALPWLPHPLPGENMPPEGFTLFKLIPAAIAISLLGAIESLLSAVIADDMTNTKHDPNVELAAQGLGNIICPFFGAIPATGAIARTATNIRFGGISPISQSTHAIFVLMSVAVFTPLLAYTPMAALAALLLFVAYNMSELEHVVDFMLHEPKDQVIVLLTCFTLTVIFDMVIGVSVGMVIYLIFKKIFRSPTPSSQPTLSPAERPAG